MIWQAKLILAFATAAALFFVARLYPIWHRRHSGCDAYFFLNCAETLRRDWRLPLRLPPTYIAEPQEQWYPPLFPVLLALLPKALLEKGHWILNHVLDFSVAGALFFISRPFVGDFGAIGVVVVYALQPALIQEFSSMTSRPLGMLIYLSVMMSSYAWFATENLVFAVPSILGIMGLVYAHKLSLQLLWFLLPFLSLATGSWSFVVTLFGGYFLAFAIWPSFFTKIVRAHFDIVSFWAREWPLLGAHPVRRAPLNASRISAKPPTYYESASVRSPIAFLSTVVKINIFVVFLLLALLLPPPGSTFADFLWWWAVGIHVWACATHFIKALRCLGLAQQYVKYSYLPVLGYTVYYISQAPSWPAFALFAVCIALLFRWYVLTTSSLRKEQTGVAPEDQLGNLVSYINAQNEPRIMAFPYHLYDEIAYRSKAQVLWGTHGYGFDQVRSFFPVLRKPIGVLADEFSLTHVIVDPSFVSTEELGLDTTTDAEMVGRFIVLRATEMKPSANHAIGKH